MTELTLKQITLDTRESKNEFIAYLVDSATARGYTVHLEALPFGDIKFGNIIIERKEIKDFCASVCSERMNEQLGHMLANLDYTSIIIISGDYNQLRKEDMDKIPRLEGMKTRIMALGVPLILCKTDEDLVNTAFELFEHSFPLETPIKRVDKDDKLGIFLSLPKVGYKDARKLFKEYKNMTELCLASQKDLIQILKPSKGALVFNALHE